MVLQRHIYKKRHYLSSSLPLDILFFFFLQLHFGIWSGGLAVTFLSCPLMISDMLLMQPQLTLTVLWLKTLLSLRIVRNRFVNQCLGNVCWNRFTKGRIKWDIVSLSRCFFFWFGVIQINIITRLLSCIFVFDQKVGFSQSKSNILPCLGNISCNKFEEIIHYSHTQEFIKHYTTSSKRYKKLNWAFKLDLQRK